MAESVTIHLPTHLQAYTKGVDRVEVNAGALGDALAGLDQRYPGIRFRFIDEQDQVREHIKLFVDRQQVFDMATPLNAGSEIHIIAALSGG